MNKEELLEFIENSICNYSGNLTMKTRISEDLRLDGDDASEFLVDFSKKFGVDISPFPFEKYFSSEGFNPLDLIKYLFKIKKYHTLTIGDLANAVENGTLR